MPNWDTGVFCGQDKAYYKFTIEKLKCPMKGCHFDVPGKRKDPIALMQEHFAAKEPHDEIGIFYCFACGDNLKTSGLLSKHCDDHAKEWKQKEKEELEKQKVKQNFNLPGLNPDGTFILLDNKVCQPNQPNVPPKPVEPKPQHYKCIVCSVKKHTQGEMNKHFKEEHREGLFYCTIKDCKTEKGEKFSFKNLYKASTHFNNHHSIHALLRNGRVRRRC